MTIERVVSRQLLATGCAAVSLFLAACGTPLLRPASVTSVVPQSAANPPVTSEPPAIPGAAEPRVALPAPPMIESPVQKLDSSMNVYFAPGSAEIPNEADTTIGGLAEKLKANRRLRVRLFAYTDDLGSREFCIAMAMQRAKAVTAELVKRGVPAGQIRRRVIGCEIAPQPVCRSAQCRQQRRRVEFRFAG